MHNAIHHRLCAAMVLVLFLALNGYGQFGVGSLIGTVSDESGAVIPGVRVIAKEKDTGVETSVLTTGTGAYRFLNLRLGTYSLTATAPGFRTVQKDDIRVILGQTAT